MEIKQRKIPLKEAVNFHGHLGPYLVLGLLMGRYAIRKIRARPHFGLKVTVWGASLRPKSCLIDGLQLSTGCTYGKGNIKKYKGNDLKVRFLNCDNKKSISLVLADEIRKELHSATSHELSQRLARKIYIMKPETVFTDKC